MDGAGASGEGRGMHKLKERGPERERKQEGKNGTEHRKVTTGSRLSTEGIKDPSIITDTSIIALYG